MIQENRLQYISQGKDVDAQLHSIRHALDAGCNWIQLRYKQRKDPQFKTLAVKVKQLSEEYKAIYIINDFPEIAKEVNADGVHVGLEDQPVEDVRKIIGPDKIIGGTANTLSQVLKRVDEKCDYVGVGPFRFTITKEKLSPILGIEGFRALASALEKRKIRIPIYAIGGIEGGDIGPLRQLNIHGVATSGLITNAQEAQRMVKQLYQDLNETIMDFQRT